MAGGGGDAGGSVPMCCLTASLMSCMQQWEVKATGMGKTFYSFGAMDNRNHNRVPLSVVSY